MSLRRLEPGPLAVTIAIHVALGWALLAGLGMSAGTLAEDALKTFTVIEEPPAPEPEVQPAQPKKSVEPEGAAAPPAKQAKPKPVVAPIPDIPLPTINPLVPAPIAGTGDQAKSGAAPLDGPGTGAGGDGDGTGAGRGGDGSGGVPVLSRARYLKGQITNRDLPRSARERGGVVGTVLAYFDVTPQGRVVNCKVEKSSGNADLDASTCRLLEQRFRYAPARDRAGRAIEDVAAWEQRWWVK